MANIDSLVTLIKDLRQGQLQDDVDPNNTVLNQYASPYDQASVNENVRWFTTQTRVWGDGTTYMAYDSNGNPWSAPSCGWLWGAGGQYTSKINGSTNDRYSDAVMKDKPLAYYRLDDTGTTAADFTGNGNAGTLSSGVTTDQSGAVVPTVGDTAMSFNGTASSAIFIPKTIQTSLVNATAMTVEAWIYPTAYPSNDSRQTIVSLNGAWYFQVLNDGSLQAYQYGTNPAGYQASTSKVSLNQWSHVAYTYDGSNLVFYINGQPCGTTSKTGAITSTTNQNIGIGQEDGNTGNRIYEGLIDEVAIYGYALSASQIAGHYNAR